ncbi:MAG TPA: hypothetical protein PLS23_13200 [Phycisphaerae bacterium]|nr:hypothetical protein [Phycisphaerae bacterium]
MTKSMHILALAAVLLAASQSVAERCGGLATNWLVLCEDFDRYCTEPPANPNDACNCETTLPDLERLQEVWQPLPKLCSGASQTHTLRSYYFNGEESWKCHKDSNLGYGLRVYQANSTGLRGMRSERDLTAEILANPANASGFGYVNGAGEISVPLTTSNEIPPSYVDSMDSALRPGALKGSFMMRLYGSAHFSNMINYVELFADDDRAPFNWVTTYCASENINHPRLVRDGDGQVHKSFAIGLVATYDANPCDVDTGRQPTFWRLVVFDGRRWQAFQAPAFDIPLTSPADQGDLFPTDGWNTVSFAIGEDYIEVRLYNRESAIRYANFNQTPRVEPCIPNPYFVARVPRQYKGPFNKIAIGPNHGLDMTANPTCEWFRVTVNDQVQYQRRCNGGENNMGACSTNDDCPVATTECSPFIRAGADLLIDELVLYDGVFDGQPAACCTPDATCRVVGPLACEALGGQSYPGVTTCNPSPCCSIPPMDSDWDGDVDMADFATLQRCLTTDPNAPAVLGVGCACFDANGDGKIDISDLTVFTGNGLEPSDPNYVPGCASGAGVPADPNCH